MHIRLLMSIALLLVLSTKAAATTITFESFPASFVSHTEAGVTFSVSGGGGLIVTAGTPNGTLGLLEDSTIRRLLRADIAGGTDSVSIDLGDFGVDADSLLLQVYDSLGVLIGSDADLIGGGFSGMVTLSVSVPNIAYAIFGGAGVSGSSVYADNFTFNEADPSVVPEPASLLLLGSGVAGLIARRRTKSRI